VYEKWYKEGFEAIYPEISAVDWLKDREVSVMQTDGDSEPISGRCGGIAPDGSLIIDGRSVWAGEAFSARVKE
jgi:hypothetical protein